MNEWINCAVFSGFAVKGVSGGTCIKMHEIRISIKTITV